MQIVAIRYPTDPHIRPLVGRQLVIVFYCTKMVVRKPKYKSTKHINTKRRLKVIVCWPLTCSDPLTEVSGRWNVCFPSSTYLWISSIIVSCASAGDVIGRIFHLPVNKMAERCRDWSIRKFGPLVYHVWRDRDVKQRHSQKCKGGNCEKRKLWHSIEYCGGWKMRHRLLWTAKRTVGLQNWEI